MRFAAIHLQTMITLTRALRALTTLAFQFGLGHALGFGTMSVLSDSTWSLAVIATGNAVGVTVAGVLGSSLAHTGPINRLRAAAGALVGAALGAGLLWTQPGLGYAGLLLPLSASILGFHVFVRKFTGRRVVTARTL